MENTDSSMYGSYSNQKKKTFSYPLRLPTKLWRKFTFKKRQKRTNKQIDAELKKSYNSYSQMLIMGSKGSGKTTICKQLNVLYGNGFSVKEKKQFIEALHQSVYNAIFVILNEINTNKELQARYEENIKYIQNYQLGSNSSEFFNNIELLWKDEAIRSLIINLEDNEQGSCAKYFFENACEYNKRDYVPSLADILQCYEATKSLMETKFRSHNYNYNVMEIPHLRCAKQLWKHMISDISIIVYVINSSSFDKVSDSGKNYFEECIEELHILHRNTWQSTTTFVVFLNKIDLFSKKIKTSNIRLETYFPEYLTHKTSDTRNGDDEVTTAISFIKNMFVNQFPPLEDTSCHCLWYIHYSCALNSKDLQLIFNECTSYVGRGHVCIHTYTLLEKL